MRTFKSKRGSLLLVTMLFACSLVIVLLCFIRVPLSAIQMSNRSLYANAAIDLVDTGLEQAMWVINDNSGSSYNAPDWTGWGKASTGVYERTFPSLTTYYNLSNGVQGQVKVYVNLTSSPYKVVSEAIVTVQNGGVASSQIVKEAEISVAPPGSPSSYFARGLVAKGPISLSGGTSLDSWNSSVTDAPSGQAPINAPVPYYSSGVYQNKTDQGKIIGSISTSADDINGLGGATVYGFAAVGGDASNDIQFSGGATLGPFGWAPPKGGSGVDPANVTYNFTQSMPDVSAPQISSASVNTTVNSFSNSGSYSGLSGGATVTLPNRNKSGTITDVSVISNGVTTYYYSLSNINLGGGSTVTISPNINVVFLLTDTATDGQTNGNLDGQGNTFAISGGSKIIIPSSSSVTIYTGGNVNLSGGGITNGSGSKDPTQMNPTTDFQLYGTRSASTAASSNEQTLTIDGGSGFSGAIYAPNANTAFNGGGDILGAVVCNQATLNGGAHFHYDIALSNLSGSGSTPATQAQLTQYRELFNASDRAAVAADVNFTSY
jgi:hypothetical protein